MQKVVSFCCITTCLKYTLILPPHPHPRYPTSSLTVPWGLFWGNIVLSVIPSLAAPAPEQLKAPATALCVPGKSTTLSLLPLTKPMLAFLSNLTFHLISLQKPFLANLLLISQTGLEPVLCAQSQHGIHWKYSFTYSVNWELLKTEVMPNLSVFPELAHV